MRLISGDFDQVVALAELFASFVQDYSVLVQVFGLPDNWVGSLWPSRSSASIAQPAARLALMHCVEALLCHTLTAHTWL